MNYPHIAIEGNIGSGKTTLANKLAAHYGARLICEEFAENSFLSKFYQDPERYAFPLEVSFLASRYNQLKGLVARDLFQEGLVSDYMLVKSKLFAQINLRDDEYTLFRQLFDIISASVPPPDLLIYLHAPVGALQRNIRERGRSYEQDISDDYLEKLQQAYHQFLKQDICRTVIIDMTSADFLGNEDHFRQLTAFLDKGYEFSQHYLSIE